MSRLCGFASGVRAHRSVRQDPVPDRAAQVREGRRLRDGGGGGAGRGRRRGGRTLRLHLRPRQERTRAQKGCGTRRRGRNYVVFSPIRINDGGESFWSLGLALSVAIEKCVNLSLATS